MIFESEMDYFSGYICVCVVELSISLHYHPSSSHVYPNLNQMNQSVSMLVFEHTEVALRYQHPAPNIRGFVCVCEFVTCRA